MATKSICFYFQVHQPDRLRQYRFFDIGNDNNYFDDFTNRVIMRRVAQKCYLPVNALLLDIIKKNGKNFKVAFSISGVAIDQFKLYAPEVIELLQELNETGCVEFLAEPYSHGLSSLANEDVFRDEVARQAKKMKELFGKKPTVLRNSSLIYSDDIGGLVADMGYKGMICEGAKHILGWKSPHFVYHCAQNPSLKLLLRDYKLSDDISLRFNDSSWNEFPLFADTYMDWIAQLPEDQQVVNIFMELCALGIYQPLSSNILEFIKALPAVAKDRGVVFATPSEVIAKSKSVGQMDVPYPMSWNDEERDTSCWLGNVMQREAFQKLYSVADRVLICKDRRITQDWDRIQASNNFRFMTTKNMGVGFYRGIYDSPYDAFTNYMNILGDFINRVNALYPSEIENDELNALLTTIRNQADEITVKDAEIARLQARLQKLQPAEADEEQKPADKKAEAKPAAKKAPAKKAEAKSAEKKPAAKKAEPKAAKPAASKKAK